MKQVSVERAFQWAQLVAVREWRLLLPVALAFFMLPGLVVDVAMPDAMQALLPSAKIDPQAQGRATLALLAMVTVNMAGWLTITTLALVPGVSVAEAIARAARRLPALIGAVLMVTAALVVALLVVALAIGSARADAASMQQLLAVLIGAAGLVLYVRLAFVAPALVEEGGGPAPALQRSWRLTKGASWRIAGAVLVYFFGGLVVLVASTSALGAIVTVAARAAGAGSVAGVLTAVIFRLIAAVINTGFQLVVAGLYRQVAPRA